MLTSEQESRPWLRLCTFSPKHADFEKVSLAMLVRGLRVTATAEGKRQGRVEALEIRTEHRAKQAIVKARLEGTKSKLFKGRHAEKGKKLTKTTKVVEAKAKEAKTNAKTNNRHPHHLITICNQLKNKGVTDEQLASAGVDSAEIVKESLESR